LGRLKDLWDLMCYGRRRDSKPFLKILNKVEFQNEIKEKVFVHFDEATEIFKANYKKRLGDKLKEVSGNYLSNIDWYSGDLERLRDDKAAVERKLEQIKELLTGINGKRNDLITKIWSKKIG
jgi:hypothetical protein